MYKYEGLWSKQFEILEKFIEILSSTQKQMVRRRRAPEAEEAKASTEASAQVIFLFNFNDEFVFGNMWVLES